MTTGVPLFLGGEAVAGDSLLAVHDKASGELLARVGCASPDMVDQAISLAVDAAPRLAGWSAWRRRDVLHHVVARIGERREEFEQLLVAEAGKPLRDARGEVARTLDTFSIAAEEATRRHGERLALDVSPRGDGYEGFTRRVPVGPCSFITPFNFPLNLVAHKLAPALAVGCPFVLKPASFTPLSALLLGEILAETDLPRGSFSILPCARGAARAFTTDERLKLLSFTGSPAVGWELKARAGSKKVVLELGGNAAAIVDAGADLDLAVTRLTQGAFGMSGQSCISVQRILIHRRHYDELRERLVAAAEAVPTGAPADAATVVGPLISADEGARVRRWIDAACRAGARLLTGGGGEGPWVAPTLLEGVPRDAEVSCREVFGPVATLTPFDDFDQALALANDSAFGLQAGVFTPDIEHAFTAFDRLEVGGVIVNDVPSMRVDSMPYGGVKQSGFGREGLRWAMEDMTELRLLVLRRPTGEPPAQRGTPEA